jgi:prepilin-type processing-associated H-X9-DG protein
LLPYFGETNLFEKIDFEELLPPQWDPLSRPVMTESVDLFLCPSDNPPASDRPGNSYCVSFGSGPGFLNSPLTPGGDDGVFTGTRIPRVSAVLDGTSQTAAVSEKLMGAWNSRSFDHRRDIWHSHLGAWLGRSPNVNEAARTCFALSEPPTDFYSYSGCTWMVSGFGFTWFNHGLTPNAAACDCSTDGPEIIGDHWSAYDGLYAARSNHPGGVNVLLLDGAVRFTSETIDLSAWRALGTRAGRERVESGF